MAVPAAPETGAAAGATAIPGDAAGPLAVRREGERVRIDGAIDFGNARDALARVTPEIETAPDLVIDLGGVTRSNSAGLALIVEWLAAARRTGHGVTFANVPDGLVQLARVCQVDRLLADASA